MTTVQFSTARAQHIAAVPRSTDVPCNSQLKILLTCSSLLCVAVAIDILTDLWYQRPCKRELRMQRPATYLCEDHLIFTFFSRPGERGSPQHIIDICMGYIVVVAFVPQIIFICAKYE